MSIKQKPKHKGGKDAFQLAGFGCVPVDFVELRLWDWDKNWQNLQAAQPLESAVAA